MTRKVYVFRGELIGLLTVYDMCKAVDRAMTIGEIRLLEKSGGKSEHFRRPEARQAARLSPIEALRYEWSPARNASIARIGAVSPNRTCRDASIRSWVLLPNSASCISLTARST